jgi:hypothetical protein
MRPCGGSKKTISPKPHAGFGLPVGKENKDAGFALKKRVSEEEAIYYIGCRGWPLLSDFPSGRK